MDTLDQGVITFFALTGGLLIIVLSVAFLKTYRKRKP